ncbi:hypothetical protein B0H11DRAFT_1908425 [Mycena galericulata]|nr:hypothetical protein B0H11DRAFT_1908425 [Mycena galericulata]
MYFYNWTPSFVFPSVLATALPRGYVLGRLGNFAKGVVEKLSPRKKRKNDEKENFASPFTYTGFFHSQRAVLTSRPAPDQSFHVFSLSPPPPRRRATRVTVKYRLVSNPPMSSKSYFRWDAIGKLVHLRPITWAGPDFILIASVQPQGQFPLFILAENRRQGRNKISDRTEITEERHRQASAPPLEIKLRPQLINGPAQRPVKTPSRPVLACLSQSRVASEFHVFEIPDQPMRARASRCMPVPAGACASKNGFYLAMSRKVLKKK